MGSIAQLAFDLFHFMFRDRILDLQVQHNVRVAIIMIVATKY